MAYNNIDQAVTLPNQFDKPGDVWQSAIERKDRTAERQAAQAERDRAFAERQREFDERQLDRNQQEEFRKIQMINEYTDLTKHQTGSDVANAVGDKIVRTQIPAFVEMAKKGASYSDLYGAIVKGVRNTATAMDGIKKELLEADSAAKLLKEKFGKSIDTDAVLKIARADIVNRRLDNEHSFVNPLTVPPSEFTSKLSDPRYLSQFVVSDEDLSNEIINPKGMDEIAVPSGTADAHNTYEAKIPYWKQANFTPEMLQKGGGFLPQGFVPQLKTKSEVIPLEKLPAEINEKKPFTVISKDVYDKFVGNDAKNLQLIAKTRKQFPNYDKFTDLEKEYAERNVLLNTIESLDRSNFRYKSTTKPARTSITNNIGGSSDIRFNDIAKQVDDALPKEGILPVTALPSEAREYFVNSVNKGRTVGLDPNQLGVIKANDGSYRILDLQEDSKGDVMGVFSRTGTNLGTNKGGVKVQQTIIKDQQGQKPTGMITVVLDGKEGQIPADKIDAFMKKYPKAKKK